MKTLAQLLLAYLLIAANLYLALLGMGGGVGPVELVIGVVVAVGVAVYLTRKILRGRVAVEPPLTADQH